MKVLLISGSRNRSGQTAQAANAILEGVAEAGGTRESFYLPELAVERCRQCNDDGWGICRTQGACVINDDFARLVDALVEADRAVFITPVYFGDISKSMRAFTDRLRRICMNETGRKRIEGKKWLGVCVAGGGGGGAPNCCVMLERVLQRDGLDLVDMVAVRRQNLKAKMAVLKEAGKLLVA